MKFFAKYVAIFLGLAILLTLGDRLFIDSWRPLSGTILFSAFISLITSIFIGWIDAVYVEKIYPDS